MVQAYLYMASIPWRKGRDTGGIQEKSSLILWRSDGPVSIFLDVDRPSICQLPYIVASSYTKIPCWIGSQLGENRPSHAWKKTAHATSMLPWRSASAAPAVLRVCHRFYSARGKNDARDGGGSGLSMDIGVGGGARLPMGYVTGRVERQHIRGPENMLR